MLRARDFFPQQKNPKLAENFFIKTNKKLSIILNDDKIIFNNSIGDITALDINNGSLKSVNILSNDLSELVISYEKNTINISEIIKFISDQNIKLLDISTDDGDLEDVFLRLIKN